MTLAEKLSYKDTTFSFVSTEEDDTEDSCSSPDDFEIAGEIADELDEFDNAITTRVKRGLSDSVPAERLEVCRALETLAGLDTNTKLSKRVSTAAEEHDIVYCQETLYDVAYWYYNE